MKGGAGLWLWQTEHICDHLWYIFSNNWSGNAGEILKICFLCGNLGSHYFSPLLWLTHAYHRVQLIMLISTVIIEENWLVYAIYYLSVWWFFLIITGPLCYFKGTTVSDLTGPDGAVDGKNYLYTEASYPRQLGDTAVLESDLTFSGTNRVL